MRGNKGTILRYLLPLFAVAFLGFYFIYKILPDTKISADQPANILNQNQSTENNPSSSPQVFDIPILMYHYIRDCPDPADQQCSSLSVSPEKFEAQLKYLQENNYQSINLDQLVKIKNKQLSIEKKPIVLTFDDGYADAYKNAFPLLLKYQMKGVFYIITGKIDDDGYLNRDQIIALYQSKMQIAAHTVNHLNLLSQTLEVAEKEIRQSKTGLEMLLGDQIDHFCYPAGKYNQDIINILIKSGFSTATTTNPGLSNQNSNVYELPRFRIQQNTTLSGILK